MQNRTIAVDGNFGSCKDCPHRRLHCHTICEDYNEYKKARAAIKDRKDRNQAREAIILTASGGKKDMRSQK